MTARSNHPDGCQCDRDACRQARAVRPRDDREARAWYCADAFPTPKWGPSLAEREASRQQARAEFDEDARAVEADLWLLRHAGVGQELGALRRLVDRSNANR